MSRRKTIDIIFCSVLTLVGCTEPEHECEAADMMMVWRIIAVSSLLLCLLLAYFLWRSYKYNNVLAKKCERLQLQDSLSRPTPDPSLLREGSIYISNGNSSSQLSTEDVTTPIPQQGGAGGGSTPLLFRRLCQLMDGPDQIYTDTELDRARLAQLLGTNEHYVSDAVSACTNGGSITDFLNGYRLRHAVRLLATTNDSIGLIAELSGFSRRSFYRVFDEEYHTSPSEYRKAMRKA